MNDKRVQTAVRLTPATRRRLRERAQTETARLRKQAGASAQQLTLRVSEQYLMEQAIERYLAEGESCEGEDLRCDRGAAAVVPSEELMTP